MQAIVDSLCALKGVRHAAIYKQGELTHSNLTVAQQASLIKSSAVILQVFTAAEAIGKTHNEIFIGVKSGYLAGFKLHTGYVVLLLTEKKINFPMMSMGVKSASETIKQLLHEEQLELDRLARLSVGKTSIVKSSDLSILPTEESLRPAFDSYTKILTGFIGPAAEILVEEAVETWKQTYVQRAENLPYLLALLEAELDSPQERHAFATKAAEVTLPAM
jgi:predicted regulator of Ras-like GTPase activity (Roadblock/LC7/MglB family)